MNFLPERGYNLMKAHPDFMATINNLSWNLFVQHRAFYLEQLVREFYSGIQQTKGDRNHSLVRGTPVYFDADQINKHYNLVYHGSAFDDKMKKYGRKNMERIKERIAFKNSTWDKITNTEFKLKSRDIIPELSNWHLFINCSIFPSSHTYTLSKDRLIMLDTILTEDYVDIGKIISKEIIDCSTKKEGFLFFPCLITELCMKQGVKISITEHQYRKFPRTAFSAEMKERKSMKPTDSSVQMHYMQRQKAVWEFIDEQHDWIQQRFDEISNVPTQLITPMFPKWVFEKPEKEKNEEEEEEETEEEESEEVPKKKATLKRKRETKKQDRKGKKKVIVEEEEEKTSSEEELEETEEDEEISRMVEEMEKNEEEEETGTEKESNGKSSEEDFDLTMEELLRKRSQHEPILTPVNQPEAQPESEGNIPSSPSSKYSTGKTPSTPTSPEKSPKKVTEPEMQPPKEKSPTPIPTENPPINSPTPVTSNIIVKETVQVTEDVTPAATNKRKEGAPDTPAVGASALSADALKEKRSAVTIIPNRGDTVKVVLEELAKKKREDIANSQKFFKKSTKSAEVKEAPKKASEESVKEAVTASEKGKGKETTESGTKETTEEEPPKNKEAEVTTKTDAEKDSAAAKKDAVKQSGASAPSAPATGASAPILETPTATLQDDTTTTPASKKKDSKKKKKVKHTPSRSSNRLKSGATK